MELSNQKTGVPRPVQIWLFIGVVMVFFQVVIGGVTRLTDSGLSITEWAVIQGTIPPLNETEWLEAFEQYKVAAKKQYESLHADMTLSEFKFIYFWEYAHRLWARLMGFVFLIPFLFFLHKKWLPRWLIRRLGVVIVLASIAAVFGWIMVKSGLHDDSRTWVSAYKLITHLAIATAIFGYLFWTWLNSLPIAPVSFPTAQLKRIGWIVAFVLFIQIVFGGLMAGMRAALIHPHFPVFVEFDRILDALRLSSEPISDQFLNYEPNRFAKAIVQILHRATAWVLAGLTVWLFIRIRKQSDLSLLNFANLLMLIMLIIQFLLGISTVINSVGQIPLYWGVVHQAGALLLLASVLFVIFLLQRSVKTQ